MDFFSHKNNRGIKSTTEINLSSSYIDYNNIKPMHLPPYDPSMPMKKMAVLLSGLHYREQYRISSSKKSVPLTIDFRLYIDNIKKHIHTYFHTYGYDVDTFLCTNESPLLKTLVESYAPKKYSVMPDTENRRIYKTYGALELVSEDTSTYDLICVTRFDINFMEPIQNIDIAKLNIFSILEHPSLIDDNFYLFPGSFLPNMLAIYKSLKDMHDKCAAHNILGKFEQTTKIHFIKNENCLVKNLTSFKLHAKAQVERKCNDKIRKIFKPFK